MGAEDFQQNGFENTGFSATIIVVGSVAKLNSQMLNALRISQLACRVISS